MIAVSLASVIALAGCSKDASQQEAAETAYKSITTEEVSENAGAEGWVIVDTRLNDAFNGWALDGVARGGHIEGAVDFSANWLLTEKEGKDEILQEALETKGILPDKNIVLYDANGTDAVAVADYLSSKGYENIYTYDVNEWASDDSKPMVQFPGYELLVPASIVKSLIDGETPETFTEGKTVKMVSVVPATLPVRLCYRSSRLRLQRRRVRSARSYRWYLTWIIASTP